MLGLISAAETLARQLLAEDLPKRWLHVQAVSDRARLFECAFDDRRLDLLVAAGLVHDVGYSDRVADTGFHPIDGARHLRQQGFPEDIVGLVAHHTCSHVEADLRNLGRTLATEFPYDPTLPHDELLFCDLTTGPTGQIVTVEDRLAEVMERYGPEDLVYRFIQLAQEDLLAAARRAEAKLIPISAR